MTLADFKDKHVNRKAWIVGKGPSLDNIYDELFPEMFISAGPIFCCNESVHCIEYCQEAFKRQARIGDGFASAPIYGVQQDSELQLDCVPILDTTVHFMNSIQHVDVVRTPEERASRLGVAKNKVEKSMWNPKAILYDQDVAALTAVAALNLAKYMGVRHVVFCCFDSWEQSGSGEYAECIGKDSGALGDTGRHAANGAWIREVASALMDKVETRLPDIGVIK